MNEAFYSDLELIKKDKEQFEAFNCKENAVVIAGPGSGKTRVLTLKAIKLLQSSINAPSGLACLSYSRETVRELKKRLDIYGYRAGSNDFIGTVHGFCLSQIIIPFAKLYPQYQIPDPLNIASNEVTQKIYEGVLKKLNVDEKTLSKIEIDRERYTSMLGASTVTLEANELAAEAAKLFEERLIKSGSLDFTMIAKLATQIIQEKDYVRHCLESRFPWILIDEYQDLGKALHEMVLTLQSATDIKIFVVGDMDQSIYGFTGAYPDFLEEIYTRDDFHSIRLKYNYRSNQEMINASIEALSPPPPGLQYEAKLRTGESAEFTFITCSSGMSEQYNVVVKKIVPYLITKAIPFNEIVILVGSNNEANQMAEALREGSLPTYVVRWLFDRSDTICWLEECVLWYNDSKNVSFDQLFTFWFYLLEIHDSQERFKAKIELKCFFYEVLQRGKTLTKLPEWVAFMVKELELMKMLKASKRYPDEFSNMEIFQQETQTGSMKDFETARLGKLGKPENEITVTTRHSVKGLEFEVVVMLGMDEMKFPDYYTVISSDPRKIMEAHRLCYVCVSRAKRACYLLRSNEYTLPGKNGPWTKKHTPSRFWKSLFSRFGSSANAFGSGQYNPKQRTKT